MVNLRRGPFSSRTFSYRRSIGSPACISVGERCPSRAYVHWFPDVPFVPHQCAQQSSFVNSRIWVSIGKNAPSVMTIISKECIFFELKEKSCMKEMAVQCLQDWSIVGRGSTWQGTRFADEFRASNVIKENEIPLLVGFQFFFFLHGSRCLRRRWQVYNNHYSINKMRSSGGCVLPDTWAPFVGVSRICWGGPPPFWNSFGQKHVCGPGRCISIDTRKETCTKPPWGSRREKKKWGKSPYPLHLVGYSPVNNCSKLTQGHSIYTFFGIRIPWGHIRTTPF